MRTVGKGTDGGGAITGGATERGVMPVVDEACVPATEGAREPKLKEAAELMVSAMA